MFLTTSKSNNTSNSHDERFSQKKLVKLENIIIYLDNDEIYIADNKAFILTGSFFGDDFPDNIKTKYQQLEFLSLLKRSHLIDFLNSIDGFYSLIVIDSKTEYFEIFSDHVCSVPVFINTDGNSITMSHNHKELIEKVPKLSINIKKVVNYFMFFNTYHSDTFFEQIVRSLPRELLEINKEEIKRREIYSFSSNNYHKSNDYQSLKNEYKRLFLRSVENCSRDYNHIGSALSGGLDSSSITSALKHIGKKNIVAKTATFSGLEDGQKNKVDETFFSDLVAKSAGIKHHKIELNNTGCISDNKITSNIFPEPTGLVNGYIHHEIFKDLKNTKISLYLDGFGGDSVIGHGYNKLYELGKKFHIYKLIYEDRALHEKKGAKYNVFRTIKKYLLPSIIPSKFLWWIDKKRKTKNWQKTWINRINKKYIEGGAFNQITNHFGHYPSKISSARSTHSANINSMNLSMGIYHATLLAKHYDAEIKFPFLSKKLMELSLNTPVEYKLFKGVDRYIFREAMREIVPQEVLDRSTKSDLSPFSMNEVNQLDTKKLLDSIKDNCGDFFDYEFLEEEVFSKKELNFTEIYQIYEFNLWLEKNHLKLD